MHSLRMVAVALLALMRNVSITANYNRNTDGVNERIMIDGQFRDNTAKYYHNNNSTHGHRNIDDNSKVIEHAKFHIKELKKNSLRQDMFKELNIFKVSYPPAEYHFFKSMLDKNLCNQYTLECIYYRSEYPHSRLSFDSKTDEEYNPCHRFVEPCFGISEHDYKIIKKFRSLKEY